MWAGLAALPAAVWLALKRGEHDLLVPVITYGVALGTWVIIPKPVMFYYHYLLPSLALCVALAGVLDRFWLAHGRKGPPIAMLAVAMLIFWDFYPIISAAALDGRGGFLRWMWFESWR
jgi:dolichyl-phosphate-mannose-protein mannosyltransferase